MRIRRFLNQTSYSLITDIMIPGIINNLSYCVYNIFRYLEKDYKHLTVLQGRSSLIVAKLRLYHN